MTTPRVTVPVDELAQEIRRVDGNHDLGAGALAEALMPFLSSRLSAAPAPEGGAEDDWRPIDSAPQDGTKIDLWGHWPERDRWTRTADATWDEERCDWKVNGFYAAQYAHPPRFTHWRAISGPAALATREEAPAGAGEIERVAKWHDDRAAFLTSKDADDEWSETEAQLHRDMAGTLRAQPPASPSTLAELHAAERLIDQQAAEIRRLKAREDAQPVAWRPVVGFEGHYEVSALGDVRNVKTGRTQAKNTMGRGYIKAEFWKDGERTQTSVHRVVAEAFLPRRDGLNEVNHIDGDKTNNAAWNLEWTDRKGNTDHSRYVLGNDVKPVLATDPETGAQEYFPSIEEAGRSGYNASGIYDALNGRKRTHGGKAWSFTEWRGPQPTHPAPDALRVAIADIAAERQRQIDSEGWSADRDDGYAVAELAKAAAAYTLSACGFTSDAAREMWPRSWSVRWWKPTTPRRDLVKAGALIAAEIERLDRAALKAEQGAK